MKGAVINPMAFFRFHPTMVLTQQGREILARSRPPVSIPLWFSLNWVLSSPKHIFQVSFHPTMVLTQQTLSMLVEAAFTSFHPTMVLTQPNANCTGHNQLFMFPSHYGSHSTGIDYDSWSDVFSFPSHYGSHSTRH